MNVHRAMTLALVLCSCNGAIPESGTASANATNCKGVYYTRDSNGDLHKWNQFWLESAHRCFTDNMPLSHRETTSETWQKNNVHCTPQPQFQSRTLISANNFYQYSDSRVYLELDASSGIFRRLILAEGKDGKAVYTRLQGCFYERPSGVYGNQLLLDTLVSKTATSQYFDPLEIFTYTQASASSMEMVRFDDVDSWDGLFCPYLNTPSGYCDLLRNGNDMFFPTLTAGQKAALKTEAQLIRQTYNYATIPKATFESLWSNPGTNRIEAVAEDYLYMVRAVVDTPQYIWSAWRDYVMGNRATPPDMSGSRAPITCYQGKRRVALNGGGSGYIYGEICYDPSTGEYAFTQS